jgi:hypothetical protein
MKKCRAAYLFLQIFFLLCHCLSNAQQLTKIDSAKKSIMVMKLILLLPAFLLLITTWT